MHEYSLVWYYQCVLHIFQYDHWLLRSRFVITCTAACTTVPNKLHKKYICSAASLTGHAGHIKKEMKYLSVRTDSDKVKQPVAPLPAFVCE